MNEFRLKALELANIHASSPDMVVCRAEEYCKFLAGQEPVAVEDNTALVSAGAGGLATEPGMRRKRVKPEAVEGAAAEITPAKELLSPPEDPAALYKKIQAAVIKLVNLPGGKDKVVGVLNKFGVPTALNLKPEQYGEVLSLLEEAAIEAPLA